MGVPSQEANVYNCNNFIVITAGFQLITNINSCLDFLFSSDGILLRADCISWRDWRHSEIDDIGEIFSYNFKKYSEFRSLTDYRMGLRNKGPHPEMKRANDLYLSTPKIGGGLRIQHGHSTWVVANEIGENFHVNQNVTIGMVQNKKPTIGSNVSVHAGAVVVGGITIGDNVVIAPNAFVNFDVPSDCTVFPAKSMIVKKKTQ